jgi:hypothetical protein
MTQLQSPIKMRVATLKMQEVPRQSSALLDLHIGLSSPPFWQPTQTKKDIFQINLPIALLQIASIKSGSKNERPSPARQGLSLLESII